MPRLAAVCLVLVIGVGGLAAQQARSPAADLEGVYQTIADTVSLPGGLKNSGSPAAIALLPAAIAQTKNVDLKSDPAKLCQPVGPFRMMARDAVRIELVPSRGSIVMMFEDVAHGLMRTIFTNRTHPPSLEPNWLGDSVGQWEGTTLVVDTVGLNDRTWLNDAGAQHSDALHLVERVRPMLNGRYLEYKMTAEDAKSLAKPYTYTRYFERINSEIMEDYCEEDQ